ncbi:uncharacterized protein LOC110037839, partial [Phalaenopsis equestris]|uniref:uncharacterized protein LOC110037839 n=1 Tax=Phalaenopsis equestris TaxID=78828 RepID=UPI0009E58B49
DEWVISRVFQKTGGVKKQRGGFATATAISSGIFTAGSVCKDMPTLPLTGEQENSFTSMERHYVPCFSTVATSNYPGPGAIACGGQAFPSVRSFQENPRNPFFLSSAAAPAPPVTECEIGGWPFDLYRK